MVGEGDVTGAVRSYLEGAEVDGGAGQHRQGGEVGLVEGTEKVGFLFENLGLGSRRREQEEDGGDGGESAHGVVAALKGKHGEIYFLKSY